LTTAALALGSAGAARAKPKPAPCPAPASGFQSCLRVLHKNAADGSVDEVRVTATLLRRVDSCPKATARRRLVLRRPDGDRLASVRRAGHCRNRIVTWRATFSSDETAPWALREGDTVDADWSGVNRKSAVEISGG
jgi:hypothetical protein